MVYVDDIVREVVVTEILPTLSTGLPIPESGQVVIVRSEVFRPEHTVALHDERAAVHLLMCLVGQSAFGSQIYGTFLSMVSVEHHYVVYLVVIDLQSRHSAYFLHRSGVEPWQGEEKYLIEHPGAIQCFAHLVPVPCSHFGLVKHFAVKEIGRTAERFMSDTRVSEIERMSRGRKGAYLVKRRAGNARQFRNLPLVTSVVRHSFQVHGKVTVGISPVGRAFVAHPVRCEQFQAIGHILGSVLQNGVGLFRIILGHGQCSQHHAGVAHHVPVGLALGPTARPSFFILRQHTVQSVLVDAGFH